MSDQSQFLLAVSLLIGLWLLAEAMGL